MRDRFKRRDTVAQACLLVLMCNIGLLGLSPSVELGLLAQSRSGEAPPEARALVVRVDSRFRDTLAGNGEFGAEQYGAGIVIAITDSLVYIATAGHVVHYGSMRLESITVTFAPLRGDSDTTRVTATRLRSNAALDLSILTIPRERGSRVIVAAERSLNRLGDSGRLQLAPVFPVGCPNTVCWQVPVPADIAFGVDDKGIPFQSDYVNAGSSGGALFNAQWEVVGLVTKDEPPRANAVPIEWVVDHVKTQWNLPVGLRKHGVPRAGYRTLVSASLLVPTGAERWPSGRIGVERRLRAGIGGHLAWLRMAPTDIHINAGMAGLTLGQQIGRWNLNLFGEVGLARVRSRYDAGGYVVVEGGQERYDEFWQGASQDGIGAGWGGSVRFVIVPHLLLEAIGGHWTFPLPNVPSNPPGLPSMFYGLGLRWGL